MYVWHFSAVTIESGRVFIKVKAQDKPAAIKKGFQALEKKGLSYAGALTANLPRVFNPW